MHFEVYRDKTNQYRWRLWAANNRIIADSGEAYHNKQDCLNMLIWIKNNSAAAAIVDIAGGP